MDIPRFSPEFMDDLIKFINDRINIPLLSEATEAMLFRAILSAIFQLLGAEEK